MEIRQLLAGVLASLAWVPLPGAVYQWTDAQGRVHFSDRPNHEAAQQIELPKSRSASPSQSIPVDRQQTRQRMLEIYEQERAEKREAAAKAKQEREERKRRCLDARIDYENYSNAGSIYKYGEEGERTYLDEQQRRAYLDRLRAKVEEYCN